LNKHTPSFLKFLKFGKFQHMFDHGYPDDHEWTRLLETYFGILETDRGDFEKEQLVAGGQDIYLCAVCKEVV
jgi:hypothetical protein